MTMAADPEPTLPPARFAFGVKHGASDQFEQWRWGVSPMFDIDVPTAEDLSNFYLNAEIQYFGDVAISRARSVATLFVRTPRVIARAGLDTITVMLYTAGRHRLTAGRTEVEADTGDIVMFDCTRPLDVNSTAYDNLSLTIPRRLLEPVIGRLDRLHGLVLRKGAPMHSLLLGFMSELFAQDATLTASAGGQIAEATARIVAAAAHSASGGRTNGPSAGTIGARIRAEIEAQLGNPDLDPDWLAEKFGVSRATLYRLFRDYGGVRHHIQERRLLHAYRGLARGSGERIGVIAERAGFPDQAAFSRAFRSMYGLSPREVANIAQNRDLPPPNTTVGFLKLHRWIGRLEPLGTD
jgi:AraC-like DNA-binding protein